MAGDQGVVTAVEHDTGVILDEWKGVIVEIDNIMGYYISERSGDGY